jgi:hypothetical protein
MLHILKSLSYNPSKWLLAHWKAGKMCSRNRYEEQLAFFSASITKQDRMVSLIKDFTVRVKKFVRAETINASLLINLYKDFDFVLYSSWYNSSLTVTFTKFIIREFHNNNSWFVKICKLNINFIPLLNNRFIIKQNKSLGISRKHMTKSNTILTDFPS